MCYFSQLPAVVGEVSVVIVIVVVVKIFKGNRRNPQFCHDEIAAPPAFLFHLVYVAPLAIGLQQVEIRR
jgi:hypothetical protein